MTKSQLFIVIFVMALFIFIAGVIVGYTKGTSGSANNALDATQTQIQANQQINQQIQEAEGKNEKCRAILNTDISECMHKI